MRSLFAAILLSLLAACGEPLPPPAELGKLYVVTRAGPATYQEDGNGAASGFEHDLAVLLAKDLGVEAHFILARDHAEALKLLKKGRAHMAAAALSPRNSSSLHYSRPIREMQQFLVQNEDALPVRKPSDLAGRTVTVLARSPQIDALESLQPRPKGLRLAKVKGLSELELLQRANTDPTMMAAVDSTHFDIGANFYPGLNAAFALPGKQALAWAFPRNGDAALFARSEAFIGRIRQDGTLARLEDRYFGHTRRLNQDDVEQFMERIQTVLPRYRRDFVEAQRLSGIDWRLIAALAYQESHWDPLATSYTNVRGMMMLTEDTADRLRVTDRLDARQSILAGARYLAELREQFPPEVTEPDRSWLAIAAYNLGMGHMNGARFIAELVKRDPNYWYEMKQVLPLLSRPEYYSRLKSGAGRGGEAVIMTENIRNYYDILRRLENPAADAQAFPMSSMPPM
ncbi:MAG: membrane-bound lytic murein transglycosylase MltF [Rhodocyclaceae bacterium]|nr:membrane-bound lytic murein transglycosylase MltF [Rhodocyclaceae bacterium]MCO5098686.1 membrane-bound lytic murein transglycosylase MltF [Rhodocyclaceae bacterium]